MIVVAFMELLPAAAAVLPVPAIARPPAHQRADDQAADQPERFFAVHAATIRRVFRKGENKKCLRKFQPRKACEDIRRGFQPHAGKVTVNGSRFNSEFNGNFFPTHSPFFEREHFRFALGKNWREVARGKFGRVVHTFGGTKLR